MLKKRGERVLEERVKVMEVDKVQRATEGFITTAIPQTLIMSITAGTH